MFESSCWSNLERQSTHTHTGNKDKCVNPGGLLGCCLCGWTWTLLHSVFVWEPEAYSCFNPRCSDPGSGSDCLPLKTSTVISTRPTLGSGLMAERSRPSPRCKYLLFMTLFSSHSLHLLYSNNPIILWQQHKWTFHPNRPQQNVGSNERTTYNNNNNKRNLKAISVPTCQECFLTVVRAIGEQHQQCFQATRKCVFAEACLAPLLMYR